MSKESPAPHCRSCRCPADRSPYDSAEALGRAYPSLSPRVRMFVFRAWRYDRLRGYADPVREAPYEILAELHGLGTEGIAEIALARNAPPMSELFR